MHDFLHWEKNLSVFSLLFFSLKYSKDTRFFGLGNSFKRKRGRPPLPSSLCSCPIHLASLLIATTLSVISCMISPSLLNLTDFILIRHHHTCRLKKGSRFDPQFPAILQKSIQVLPLSLFLLGNFGFGWDQCWVVLGSEFCYLLESNARVCWCLSPGVYEGVNAFLLAQWIGLVGGCPWGISPIWPEQWIRSARASRTWRRILTAL